MPMASIDAKDKAPSRARRAILPAEGANTCIQLGNNLAKFDAPASPTRACLSSTFILPKLAREELC